MALLALVHGNPETAAVWDHPARRPTSGPAPPRAQPDPASERQGNDRSSWACRAGPAWLAVRRSRGCRGGAGYRFAEDEPEPYLSPLEAEARAAEAWHAAHAQTAEPKVRYRGAAWQWALERRPPAPLWRGTQGRIVIPAACHLEDPASDPDHRRRGLGRGHWHPLGFASAADLSRAFRAASACRRRSTAGPRGLPRLLRGKPTTGSPPPADTGGMTHWRQRYGDQPVRGPGCRIRVPHAAGEHLRPADEAAAGGKRGSPCG